MSSAGLKTPGYQPTFGNGAPGANVSTAMPYFDISGANPSKYVYTNGAWHNIGGGAGINATQIQGNNVKNAAPGANTILTWVTANTDWEGV
jgi:hypothetical protein